MVYNIKKDIDINLVRHLYNSKLMSVQSIAKELNCSGNTIWDRLKESGIRLRGQHKWQTEIEKSRKDEIIRLYTQEKLTAKNVGNKVGYSKHTVLRILRKYGIPRRKGGSHEQRGDKNPFWKGGFTHNGDGYKLIRCKHPRANNGYVFEHLIIWEKFNKKTLPKGWVIHHLNGIKTDNRPENLKGISRGKHLALGLLYYERIKELEEENKVLKQEIKDIKPVVS